MVRGDSHFCLSRGEAVDRSPSRSQLCDRIDQPCRFASVGAEVMLEAASLWARWGTITRVHSTSSSRDVVAFAPRGHQGCSVRPGVTTRFVVTDMEHARTQVVYVPLHCARGQMENEMKDLLSDIGSYVLPSLRGRPVAVVAAFGPLRVPRYTTP